MAKTPDTDAPRRFYREAGVGEADGGFRILLDGRTAKTPAGAVLILPTAALARLIADEWDAQVGVIDFPSMPATRLGFTAIDHAAPARAGLAAEIARYAASDLLCYFAETPAKLVERQTEAWGPLLDWADRSLGVMLKQARGIMHQSQDPRALARVDALAMELDDFSLTGLAHATGLFGSAVLAFALQRGRLGGDEAFDLSRLDEAFQEARWGVDEEAAARAAAMRADAQSLDRWFRALA